MPEYVAVPDTLLENTKELKKYLDFSYEYVKTKAEAHEEEVLNLQKHS